MTQVQNISMSFTVTGAKVSNTSALQKTEANLRPLTDLKGQGFICDGSCHFYNAENPLDDYGKIGCRSHLGTPMTLTVTSASVINALTLRIVGNGSITANGETFRVTEFTVIPVNANTITLTLTPDEDERLEVDDVQSGISISFNDDNLIYCSLDLASDCSIVGGDWQVSSIEVQGYYPRDLSEVIGNMGDGVPITYYSGYEGDYSIPRRFYLSEEVTQVNGVITIKGVDASDRLETKTQEETLWTCQRNTCRSDIYSKMCSWVTSSGITLSQKETPPSAEGTNKTKHTVMLKEGTFKEHIQEWMRFTNKNGFFPRYIDAGIPTMRWSEPTPKWMIKEEDVGDLSFEYERNINKLYGSDKEFPLHCNLNRATTKSTIQTRNMTKGKNLEIQYDNNYFDSISFNTKYAKKVAQTLHSLTLQALVTTKSVKYKVKSGWTKKKKRYKKGAVPNSIKKAKGYKVVTKSKNYVTVQWKEAKYVTKSKQVPQLVVKGYKVTMASGSSNTVSTSRLGVAKEIDSKVWGRFVSNFGTSSYYVPDYNDAFLKSNVKGSFIWKGNPHIQPRDVFTFVRLDGTSFPCTIERIETQHEGGGMQSRITFRKGVM